MENDIPERWARCLHASELGAVANTAQEIVSRFSHEDITAQLRDELIRQDRLSVAALQCALSLLEKHPHRLGNGGQGYPA